MGGAASVGPADSIEPPDSIDSTLRECLENEADDADIVDEVEGAPPAQRVRGERKRRRGGRSHAAAKRERDAARAAQEGDGASHQHKPETRTDDT